VARGHFKKDKVATPPRGTPERRPIHQETACVQSSTNLPAREAGANRPGQWSPASVVVTAHIAATRDITKRVEPRLNHLAPHGFRDGTGKDGEACLTCSPFHRSPPDPAVAFDRAKVAVHKHDTMWIRPGEGSMPADLVIEGEGSETSV